MSASDTTCWGCPGCGAVLTTRTAVAHVCGAGMGCESENAGGAADTGAQREYGGILAAAVVADIRPYAPEVCDSHENLRDAHAALTARLAAVERERATLTKALFHYGGHTAGCVPRREQPCSCGWSETREWGLRILEPPDGR
jgi:hypothetical protein